MEGKAQIIELEQLEKELKIVHLAVGETTNKLQGILYSYAGTEGVKEVFDELMEKVLKIDSIDSGLEEKAYIPFKKTVDDTKMELFKIIQTS
ncbi:MAG: hypothetical protein U0V04_19485 [Spirosomataceae bacterium]